MKTPKYKPRMSKQEQETTTEVSKIKNFDSFDSFCNNTVAFNEHGKHAGINGVKTRTSGPFDLSL